MISLIVIIIIIILLLLLLFIIVIIIVIIVNLQYVFDLYLFDIYTAAISCSCYLLQLQDRLLAVIAEASALSDGLEASVSAHRLKGYDGDAAAALLFLISNLCFFFFMDINGI